MPPERRAKMRRHALELILVCTIGLVPWTIYLALTLPNQYRTHHWALAWAGFDALELLAMAATAYFGFRRKQLGVLFALITSVLLVCDAWFDVALDLGSPDIWGSVASAVFIELPLAFFIARRALLLVSLTVAQARTAAGLEGPPPRLRDMPLFGSWEPDGD